MWDKNQSWTGGSFAAPLPGGSPESRNRRSETRARHSPSPAPPPSRTRRACGNRGCATDRRHWVNRNLAPESHTDRKSTRLNSSHLGISYAVFCLKKKKQKTTNEVHHATTSATVYRTHLGANT